MKVVTPACCGRQMALQIATDTWYEFFCALCGQTKVVAKEKT